MRETAPLGFWAVGRGAPPTLVPAHFFPGSDAVLAGQLSGALPVGGLWEEERVPLGGRCEAIPPKEHRGSLLNCHLRFWQILETR